MESAITLSAQELQRNYILACQSVARTSLSLEVDGLEGLPNNDLVERVGQITHQTRLTDDIVELRVSLDEPLRYTAGQYAEMSTPGLVRSRQYSFASAPTPGGQQRTLQFFIRLVPGGEFTEWLFKEPRVGVNVRVRGPFGNLWLRPKAEPVLCVAGGSGLAPVKALIEAAAAEGNARQFTVVFGARTQTDIYGIAGLQRLAESGDLDLTVITVLSDEPVDSTWRGRRGLVTDAIESLPAELLTSCDVYACGPPPMVDAVEEQICSMRGGSGFFHADRFLDRSTPSRGRMQSRL
jgi:NAD(P)H-flavin reductase